MIGKTKGINRRKTMLEVEKEEQKFQMMESYRSLVLNHFDNKNDEVYFSGVKVNGKNEGFCEVLTSNYFFKGFFKNGEKNGDGIIQIKSNFHESLGLENITGLKSQSVLAINKGRKHNEKISRKIMMKRLHYLRGNLRRINSKELSISQ